MARTQDATKPVFVDRVRRPRGVTAVVMLLILQALLFALASVAVLVGRDEPEVRDAFDGSEVLLATTCVGLAILAIATFALTVLLARGSARARSVVGFFNTVEVAVGVYSLVALRDLRAESVWGLALPVAVLWFLYGSEATRDFFDR